MGESNIIVPDIQTVQVAQPTLNDYVYMWMDTIMQNFACVCVYEGGSWEAGFPLASHNDMIEVANN